MISWRSSSPVAALTMRTWRSWTSSRTGVRAWVRPMPMWWRRPLTRRVTLPWCRCGRAGRGRGSGGRGLRQGWLWGGPGRPRPGSLGRAGTGGGAAGCRRPRTGLGAAAARPGWWAGGVGRAATASASAGTARPCHRWWVCSGGCFLLDVAAAQLGLQGVAAAAAASKARGEDHPVVGQGRGRNAEAGHRGQEAVARDRAGHRLVGGHIQGVAAVVVQPGQDLGVTSGCRGRPGERIVGEIRLPALVRQLCLEPLVGGLGALGGLWGDQPQPGQVAADGGCRDADAVVVGEVPGDGVRPGVQARGGELAAESGDQRDGGWWIAVGLVLGRRERGWNAASPSAR
jgi:hypothetical protein